MRTIFATVVAAYLYANPSLTLGQDDRPPTEEVLVMATPLGGILQPHIELRGDKLLLKAASTIGETLSNELGVSSSYFGPAASRPIIRGLGGSRVSVLTNGVASLDVSDVSPDHAISVEPIVADAIEFVRGPAALLYGSSAASGIINVTDSRIPSRATEKFFSGIFEFRSDTATEERTYVTRLDGGSEKIAWHLDALTRETENVHIDSYATAGPFIRPDNERKGRLSNSYSESDSYSAGLSRVGERGYLGGSFSRIDQTYGLPGPTSEADEVGIEPAIYEGPLLDMNQTRIDVRGKRLFDNRVFTSLKFDFGRNDYEHKEVEPSGEIATRFDNQAWQARMELALSPWADWDGVVGVQLDDRDFSAAGEEAFVSPTATDSIGIFTIGTRNYTWGELFVGARFESTEHNNNISGTYDASGFSVGLGAAFNLPHELELITNFTRTERHPSTEELFSNGAHIATRQFEIGLIMRPGGYADTENSVNFDIGLSRSVGRTRFDANLFFYNIGDYIYQDITGGTVDGFPVARYTQDDAEFYGFELELLFPLIKPKRFQTELRLFTDYTSAGLANGDDLPRIPPWRVGLNFDVEWGTWAAGANLAYHANKTDISSFKTKAYTMLDLHDMYKIDRHHFDWEIFARATNLFDQNARKSTSVLAAYAPLPGRSLQLGVRLRF